ncbi:MAG: radical SAM protein [Phycisphaerales bacterium]|nr:radical SAM protein [Phycisphaerales bacterium]
MMTQSPNQSMLHQVGLSDVLKPVRDTKIQVLICEPQLVTYELPYLPVMWGILKTYWEHNANHPELASWYEPIYEMLDPDSLISPYLNKEIDIIGLSCYTWNWRLQQEIARRFRKSHPDSLIVVGGPHPDYKDPKFFHKNPEIDAIVVKDGEVPFTRIIERATGFKTMRAFRDAGCPLHDIPGLCLPDTVGNLTAPSELPTSHHVSPYLEQRSYYERFFHEHRGGVCVAWETSRGCPFRCSYCDWGSSTMSKVRRFDLKRLYDEIEWFSENKTVSLFSVDSNFGMFKSDVELTDKVIQAKKKHGYPQYFVYSNAKNVPDRTVEITRKVVNAGLDTAHTLSIQHSSEHVLEATDRKNISIDKQIQVVRELQADGIPISVQLILGLPRDTPTLWRRTFTDLMEWGIHDGYVITNYHLLPNAPAAAPEYRNTWGLKTIERYIYDGNGIQENGPINPLTHARGEVIVETSSFTQDDWVTMSTEAAVIRGLHNPGVTQMIARGLRRILGIAYEDFYALIIEIVFQNNSDLRNTYDQVYACYRNFLRDENSRALMPIPGRTDDDLLTEPHRWLFAQVCRQQSIFYHDLAETLVSKYGREDLVRSLCNYQQSILVLPDYDKQAGAIRRCNHDWAQYFDSLEAGATVSEPPAPTRGALEIADTGWDDRSGRSEYNWIPGNTPESWTDWFRCIAYGRLSALKGNHQRLIFRASDAMSNQTPERVRA